MSKPMKQKSNRAAQRRERRSIRWAIAAAVLLAAVGASAYFLMPGPGSPGAGVGAIIAEAASLGDPDAPVVIEDFSDFQCTACRYLTTAVMPELIRDYVDQGIVLLKYRHFSHYGQESIWAAMAAECANEQGQFWPYHDRLFALQRGMNSGAFSKEKLRAYAADVGLNESEFSACLDSNKYLAKIQKDTQEVRSRGGQGTPTLFINGTILGGVPPMDQLRTLIQGKLN